MPAIDPGKAKAKATFPHAGTFCALAAEPGGLLYAGSDDYAIYVFDPASPKKEPLAKWARHDNYVSALVYANRSGKKLLISASYDRSLVWWDAGAGQVLRTVPAHQGWVRDLIATPDGSRVASAGDDMLVKVWDTDSGKLLHTLKGHADRTPQGHVTALYALAISPDGKFLASGDRIGAVRVWEMDTGKLAQSFDVAIVYTYDDRQRKRSLGGIRSLAFSPDGSLLAIGGMGQVGNVDGLAGPAHVEVWDWRKPQKPLAGGAQGHKGLVNALVFHPREPWLLGVGGGSDNGFLAFWKTDNLAPQRLKTDGHLHRCWLTPGGNELVAAGYHKLEIWTLA